jgi:iron-sulfur cluster repair protein YtfE (RIC family)
MVSRYGGMFVNGLHEHHTIAGTYYFRKLVAKDTRVEKGFVIPDKDHYDIHAFLSSFVDRANEVIQTGADRNRLQTVAGTFQAELADLERLLDRHLIDEEELILPVILRDGSAGSG